MERVIRTSTGPDCNDELTCELPLSAPNRALSRHNHEQSAPRSGMDCRWAAAKPSSEFCTGTGRPSASSRRWIDAKVGGVRFDLLSGGGRVELDLGKHRGSVKPDLGQRGCTFKSGDGSRVDVRGEHSARRQAPDRGYEVRMIGPDTISGEYFLRIAGKSSEGMLFPSWPDLRNKPEAAPLVAKFRAKNYEPEGITFPTYVAVQVWAEAVERAGTLELDAVIETLRSHKFETLFGLIGFDAKGDVTGYEPYVWYVWKSGHYVPVEQSSQ
jgi:hypothetical protein